MAVVQYGACVYPVKIIYM